MQSLLMNIIHYYTRVYLHNYTRKITNTIVIIYFNYGAIVDGVFLGKILL